MKNIAVIGCGNMGYALLCGLLKNEGFKKEDITCADKIEKSLERAKLLGVRTFFDARDAVKGADTVILAVKPNALESLAGEISQFIEEDALIVSILAGKTRKALEGFFGDKRKIVRVMPNTPALVGCGMSGLCGNENVTDSELDGVRVLLSGFGLAGIVREELMDCVTGISGSGPAYVYMFIEGLMKAGIENGMSEEEARLFSAQTVKGAAQMVLSSSESVEQLRINVCSPGGTTIEAVDVFNRLGLEGIIKEAVAACIKKSKLLSK